MINHLWQSTVFAVAAAALTVAFRENRAQVRFGLWFAASVKFLVPFAMLLSLAGWFQMVPAKKVAAPAVSSAIVEISEPFSDAAPVRPAPRHRDWAPIAAISIWACGFLAIAVMRLHAWLRIRAAVRAGVPIEVPAPVEVRSAEGLLEPGIYGLRKPVLLLPADIMTRLTQEQMEAVLAHELCHVRRNDNLTAVIQMVVEAAFWFHPLVWWIGKRMVEERESACDEEVLRAGNLPEVYAEAILGVCRYYLESRLACVAGISGSDLKKRVQAILAGRLSRELNFAKKVALVCAGIAAIALPVLVGVLRAQTAVPKWEVASIKACEARQPAGGGGGAKGGRGGGNAAANSPDRLSLPCLPARFLIREAYIDFADGEFRTNRDSRLEGGPDWIDSQSQRYMVTAKAEGTPGQMMMHGPMLAALLEDRFKLKIHHETREIPLYALTLTKGGLKLQKAAEGSCVVRDRTKFPPTPLEEGEKPCGMGVMIAKKDGAVTLLGNGATMTELARMAGGGAGRPVIDRTGVEGRFDFRVKFMPADKTPAAEDADAPSIFTAIGELGLKLEPIKGAREFLVIDHIERPTEN